MKMDGCWVEENDESYQVCMRWWFMWSVWCGYENEIDVRREVRRCLSFMWFVFVTHSDCVFVMSTEYTLFDKRIDFSIEWSLIGKQSIIEISIWLEYYWIDHTLMIWIQLLWLLEQKWRSVFVKNRRMKSYSDCLNSNDCCDRRYSCPSEFDIWIDNELYQLRDCYMFYEAWMIAVSSQSSLIQSTPTEVLGIQSIQPQSVDLHTLFLQLLILNTFLRLSIDKPFP